VQYFEESGIRVDFPDCNWFRFCDMPTYTSLSGQNLKEMDCGWWDNQQDVLWLIELKGEEVWLSESSQMMRQCKQIERPSLSRQEPKLLHTLLVKAVDSLLLLGSIWSGTRTGNEFLNHLPSGLSSYPGDGNIELLFVIDTPHQRQGSMIFVRDQLNRLLQGKLKLYNIRRIEVLDINNATRPARLRQSRLAISRAIS
jgi:hypothetical protein